MLAVMTRWSIRTRPMGTGNCTILTLEDSAVASLKTKHASTIWRQHGDLGGGWEEWRILGGQKAKTMRSEGMQHKRTDGKNVTTPPLPMQKCRGS